MKGNKPLKLRLKEVNYNNIDIHFKYLSLSHPNLIERFAFQQWKSRFIIDTINNDQKWIFNDLNESKKDYGMKLDIGPFQFSRWSRRNEFEISSYELDGTSLLYRNNRFEIGDIILCNRSDDSDGIYTTLVEGFQNFSHAAMFTILEKDNKKFPAIVEVQDDGVFAVPLRVYLSKKFCTYVEIYRHKQITPQIQKNMSLESLKIIHEKHGFDIMMDESQSVYLSCALTVSQLYQRSGMSKFLGHSRYSLKTLKNLQILGVESCTNQDLLMPDDYSKMEDLSLIGVIDNNCLNEIIARRLMKERMQEVWQTKILNPKNFPILFPVIKFGVQQVQKRTGVLGSLIARAAGFTIESFPSGPSAFIALSPTVVARVEKASRRISNGLVKMEANFLHHTPWEEISKHPEVRSLVLNAMNDFEKLFD